MKAFYDIWDIIFSLLQAAQEVYEWLFRDITIVGLGTFKPVFITGAVLIILIIWGLAR